MKTGARAAGLAALVQAGCYLFGFALLTTAMNPGDVEGWSPRQEIDFILARQGLFHLWSIVIYVVFGVALVVLTSVLHRLLSRPDSLLMSIATPFGFIWAGLVIASGMVASVGISAVATASARSAEEAAQLWAAIGAVQNGLGGGVELVGGLWVLLLSVSALRSRRVFSGALNWLGVVVGVAGIATIVPGLSVLGAVFGLVQIVWFVGVGVALLRWDLPMEAPRTQV